MGLGHNDPWVESHIRPQQMWGQRSSRGQWPLVQVFAKTVTVSTYFHVCSGETRGSRTTCLEIVPKKCKILREMEYTMLHHFVTMKLTSRALARDLSTHLFDRAIVFLEGQKIASLDEYYFLEAGQLPNLLLSHCLQSLVNVSELLTQRHSMI